MIGKIIVYDRRIRGGEQWTVRSKEGTWKEILSWAQKHNHKVVDRLEITIERYKDASLFVFDTKKMEVVREEPNFFNFVFFVFDKQKNIVSVHFRFERALKILEYLEKKIGDSFDINLMYTLDFEN